MIELLTGLHIYANVPDEWVKRQGRSDHHTSILIELQLVGSLRALMVLRQAYQTKRDQLDLGQMDGLLTCTSV